MTVMRALLRILFLAWPLAEVIVLILIGQHFGGWWVLGLVVGSMVLGSIALRTAGRAAIGEVRAMQIDPNTIVVDADGNRLDQPQGPQISHRGLLAVGGVLLLIPGAISSAFGALLLLPPVRAMVARTASRWARGRIEQTLGPSVQFGPGLFGSVGDRDIPTPGPVDIEVVSIRPVHPESTAAPATDTAPKAIGPAKGRTDGQEHS